MAESFDMPIPRKLVVESYLDNLRQKNCFLWMSWNANIKILFHQTREYSEIDEDKENHLREAWDGLVKKSLQQWQINTQGLIVSEQLDNTDIEEHQLMDDGGGDDVAGLVDMLADVDVGEEEIDDYEQE